MAFAHNETTRDTVQLSCQVQTIHIEDGLFAFRREFRVDVDNGVGPFHRSDVWPEHKTDFGFVDAENLEKLRQHVPFQTLDLTVVSGERLVKAQHEGFHEAFPQPIDPRFDPVAWLESHDWTPANVVRVDWAGSGLFDRHGAPLPQLVILDWIESRITEGSHDLPAMVDHLFQRPDIRVLHKDAEFIERFAQTPSEAFFSLPVYDDEVRQPGSTQSVQFVWVPPVNEYRQAWAWGDSGYPGAAYTNLPAAFMALDLGGLSAFCHRNA